MHSIDDLIKSIIEGKIEFEKDIWKNISSEAKDLVKKCLNVNPKKRITPIKALQHNWFIKQQKKVKIDSLYWNSIQINFK